MLRRLFISLLFLCSSSAYASHIVGGEFELLYLEKNTYRLQLFIYFDAVNGFPLLLNQDVYAHIFRKSDNKLMMIKFLPKITDENVPYYQEWCSYNEVQTTRIIYGAVITLDDENFSDPAGYYVAWENCCRNYDVTNVKTGDLPTQGTDPENLGDFSGQTYYLEFPPVTKNGQPYINSSPNLFPALNSYACPNIQYWADFAGVDADGDSVTYEITSPVDILPDRETNITRPAPYPPVKWEAGFSLENIMGGDPDLAITKAGFLTVTPLNVGLFVFAVKCTEFREGVRIGEVIREFQLYVTDICSPLFTPVIQSKTMAETTYSSEEQVSINFGNSVSDADRCINIKVSDQDASIGEFVSIEAIPLNFEGEVTMVLPEVTETLLENGDFYEFDICFPECPLVDPLQKDVFEIGILAFDDSCPLPQVDTLRLYVHIDPPANSEPILKINGSQNRYFNLEVTQGIDGTVSLPINGVDIDNQNLILSLFPDNFEPGLIGIDFSEPVASPGSLSSQFIWDFDCANGLDFSQGKDVSVDPNETRKAFSILAILEDEDDCSFNRADTVEMNLVVKFPNERHPNVFLVGEDESQDKFDFEYDLFETARLTIKALDGLGDSDRINLSAIGDGFSLEDFGMTFPGVSNGEGVEPGSVSDFVWPLSCDFIDLEQQDTFRVFFVATDINDCTLANTDTLEVNFKLNYEPNIEPELFIESIPGEVDIVDNELTIDAFSDFRFNLVGTDSNDDSLFLKLVSISGVAQNADFSFTETKGKGNVITTFQMTPDCRMLGRESSDADYLLVFALEDRHCREVASDELSFKLKLTNRELAEEIFLPPNVFTPNGDGLNDYFGMYQINPDTKVEELILPLDDCVGQFEQVSIINRWGVEVYKDTERNFKWAGDNAGPGVYFYRLAFTDRDYKGTITLID